MNDVLPDPAVNTAWILGNQVLPGHIDPDSLALRWVNGTRTYGELRDRALRLARALRAAGLQSGDRVGVHLYNRGETFELYFACAFAGLTLVPISFRLTEHEIASILDDCTPGVVVTETQLRPELEGALKSLTAEKPSIVELNADGEEGTEYAYLMEFEPIAEMARTDIHLLLFSSGTTGRPKGIEMRHRNIMWCALQQATLYQGMSERPVTMLTGPMYNTAALNEQSIPTFLAGGTVTIMPSRGWRPHNMAALMAQWGVTHALVYPSMMGPMLEADQTEPLALDSLRFVLTGGENCPPALMRRFHDRWPHATLCVAYGSTESGIVSLLWDDEIWARPGSVGRPAGGQSVTVVDNDGRLVAADEIGEIVTAGPSVVDGYWRASELTAAAFVGGWLKMGDLGRMDSDGYLYIEGRSKDLIISKGQNIYPAEVENVLREHPDLVDASVVGVPDVEAGEAVCAVVVVREGVDLLADDIVAFVQARLASYKKPKHVVVVPELPRNPSGKVLKGELTSLVAKQMGAAR